MTKYADTFDAVVLGNGGSLQPLTELVELIDANGRAREVSGTPRAPHCRRRSRAAPCGRVCPTAAALTSWAALGCAQIELANIRKRLRRNSLSANNLPVFDPSKTGAPVGRARRPFYECRCDGRRTRGIAPCHRTGHSQLAGRHRRLDQSVWAPADDPTPYGARECSSVHGSCRSTCRMRGEQNMCLCAVVTTRRATGRIVSCVCT
eukprot:2259231-Prymnesium_polylepis.2